MWPYVWEVHMIVHYHSSRRWSNLVHSVKEIKKFHNNQIFYTLKNFLYLWIFYTKWTNRLNQKNYFLEQLGAVNKKIWKKIYSNQISHTSTLSKLNWIEFFMPHGLLYKIKNFWIFYFMECLVHSIKKFSYFCLTNNFFILIEESNSVYLLHFRIFFSIFN